jgi:NAD(P)-dependent dehydrogenase (short-subunit alcohol dehydrogenase family)
MGLLEGKVALVTGAARGIGEATARLFAAEGARVVVNDLGCEPDGSSADPELARVVAMDLCSQFGDRRAVSSGHDIADPAAAQAMVALAVEEFGRLDILVNNAGVALDETLMRSSPEHRRRIYDVLVEGSFRCIQESARAMRTSEAKGSIVNTTSVAGLVGNYGQAAYSAATAALYGMTRTASIELQRHGIRVNAVCPLAKTRLTEHLPMFEKVDSLTPGHVAPVHLFLGSELSDRVSGQVLSVAGGRLSTYRVVESAGSFKERDEGIWIAEEVADNWSAINRG